MHPRTIARFSARIRGLWIAVAVSMAACSGGSSSLDAGDAAAGNDASSDAGGVDRPDASDTADAGADATNPVTHDAGAQDDGGTDAEDGGAGAGDAAAIPCTADGWCNELPSGGFVYGNTTYVMTFWGVWGSGPGDVWVVGNGAAHFDGSGWTAPWPGVPSLDFFDVWGTGPSDAWAVGSGTNETIEHWDGSSWTPDAMGTNVGTGIWGSRADDVWLVGGPSIRHWNGTTWSSFDTGGTAFNAVWGSGPDDVWAVGNAGAIWHWDGTAWSPPSDADAAPGDAQASDAMSVADASAPERYDLYRVWGTGPNDAWAVGGGGSGFYGIILHWDGSSWSVSDSGSSTLAGVWADAPDDAWAVGVVGTILHWNGSSWSATASGVTDDLVSVWGDGPSDLWAVGGATILRRQ